MRDAAFRSNKESPEADLVRDIALEPTKARAKLDRVKKALLIARARTLHLEAVELKLAAAIEDGVSEGWFVDNVMPCLDR